MKWNWIAPVVVVAVVGLILFGLIQGSTKAIKTQQKEQAKWEEKNAWIMPGEFVRVKLTGDKAQVRYSYTYSKHVYCLVASGRRYRDGVVSADSFKAEYVEVKFCIDELEPWEGDEHAERTTSD